MPTPIVESYFAESTLIAFVHCVPIRDNCLDLKQKILWWCESRADKCESISLAALASQVDSRIYGLTRAGGISLVILEVIL